MWIATLKERLQLTQEETAAAANLLLDDDLCDHVLQEITNELETYAGKSRVTLTYGPKYS